MAGKPDLSVSSAQQQPQPPGVQNVVVYVSNDNFAQAYAVNQHHQNVAGFPSQNPPATSQQNGGYAITSGSPSMASMASKNNKSVLVNHHGGTVFENGASHQPANFYTSNVINPNYQQHNLNAYHQQHQNNTVPVTVITSNAFENVKNNVINFSSASGSSSVGGELYSISASSVDPQKQIFTQSTKPNISVFSVSDKQNISGRPDKDTETYIATDSGFVAVMGADINGQISFSRCDSARSDSGPEPNNGQYPRCDSVRTESIPEAQNNGIVQYSRCDTGQNEIVQFSRCDSVHSDNTVQNNGIVQFPRCDSVHSDNSAQNATVQFSRCDSAQNGIVQFSRCDSVRSETVEISGQNVISFPRCDSVRSDAAESSCSSLSSSGEVESSSGVVLMSSSSSSSSSNGQQHVSTGGGDLVMYDNSNGVSVNMRPGGPGGQQIAAGNLVLTMVPPNVSAGGNNIITQQIQQQAPNQQPPAITVPFGWKRIVTNGLVIYISPSSTALSSLEQVKEYLMTQGTCKCGLECPLKYDTVFNFDPKVNAKPYTLSPDTNTGDLTKLCNHKRKLLAMASPSPKPAPVAAVPVDSSKLRKDGGIKRKKRKMGAYSGISVSQLLAQREKNALNQQQAFAKDQTNIQFAQQQQQTQWSGSMIPGVPNINRQPTFVENNQINPQIPQQFIRYPTNPNQAGNGQINRVLPNQSMMVGGSMMIPQQANTVTNLTQQQHQQIQQQQQLQQQLQNQQMIYQQIQQNQTNQNQQIIGPNGQVMNLHQTQNHLGQVINGQVNQMITGNTVQVNNNTNGIILQGHNISQQQRIPHNRPIQPNMIQNGQNLQQQQQQEFQRIQQQQFFNQNVQFQNQEQNKQQFDNNKAIRPNFIPTSNNTVFTGYRTDGISQNAVMLPQNHQMVMMTPQKQTWQQNKSNSPQQQNQNIIQVQQNQLVNQNGNVYERVPPLHHPLPPVWNEDINRKKVKSKTSKKQRYNQDHQQRLNDQHPPCPNIDVRQIPVDNSNKNVINNQYQQNTGPSFMEDPSGYLAQQTALLNSTISRQTGANNCTSYMCQSPNSSQSNTNGIPLPSNIMKQQVFNNRTNIVKPNQHHPHFNQVSQNIPDSSAINDQCHGCTDQQFHDQNDPRLNYKPNQQMRVYQQSPRPNSQPNTPNPNSDDNPVTSSTYIERHGQQPGYVPSPDSRPIQGGTVSTSNGSPVDQNQPEPSPTPSTPTPRNSDTPIQQSMPNSTVVYSFCNQISNSGNTTNVLAQGSNAPQKLDGYCPHPHTTGSPLGIVSRITGPTPFSVHSGMITTMASGRTVGHNTITSVLAGRASTATVSINSPAAVPVSSSAPFTSQGNTLITAAGQSINLNVSKSPLEMVQSVVSSIQIPHSAVNNLQPNQQISPQQIIKQGQGLPPGHILVSSGGQLLMASTGSNGQGIMAPPPPKLTNNGNPMPPLSASPMITNVTASVAQVIPAVAQQVLGQQTVLVNTLPAPFVIQPGMVTVDGMTVGQNMQIPHLVTGNVIQQQIQIEGNQDMNNRGQHHSPGFVSRQSTLLSPESNKKKGKKRKMSSQTVASMLHIASQQNSGMVMQQPQQGFSQQGFQMAHSPQGLTAGPIMQALTIVPGKAGVSPQIVMNGQSATAGSFGTQQLITNSQGAPQINLLQPVNLLNGATGVVQNFPTIQQFIVPNLGGMVMSADGTATLVQDASNIGMQLQLQNVNGQNVLTPVQGTGSMFNQGQSILAAGPAGMVIRTPGTSQGKIIQQQHSPGAQFLSPNGSQFIMNGQQFNGQLSPLIANVSPTQQVTFSTTPQSIRPNTQQQEFIQCNQMGQTLMVPCAPAPTITVTTASSQQNTTFVHQNTTIVQQQTTMVSNNQIQNFANQNNNQNQQNITESTTTLNVDQNFVINNQDKQQQMLLLQQQRHSPQSAAMLRHSVSTQTAVNQKLQASAVTTNTFCQTSMTSSAGSPPDTTTHSPLAPGGQSPANADTTTHSIGTGSTDEGLSPAPSNSSVTGNCADIIAIQARQQAASMAMVHCISSSEPDSGDLSGPQSDLDWRNNTSNLNYKPEYELPHPHNIRKPDTPTHNNMAYVESSTVVSGMHFVTAESMKTQESVVSSRHYEKTPMLKRKHGDTLVVMETRHNMHHTSLQDDEEEPTKPNETPNSFDVGDLVWGPAHGCPSWPGKLLETPTSGAKVLVRWFGGDKAPSKVDITALLTLTEGLDAHHRARKKCRKSRKLNTQLENAINEAMAELDRMTADQNEKIQEKIEPKIMASILIKGEIAGRLRSSQR